MNYNGDDEKVDDGEEENGDNDNEEVVDDECEYWYDVDGGVTLLHFKISEQQYI